MEQQQVRHAMTPPKQCLADVNSLLSNHYVGDPTCKLCSYGPENVEHFILKCHFRDTARGLALESALPQVRPYLPHPSPIYAQQRPRDVTLDLTSQRTGG